MIFQRFSIFVRVMDNKWRFYPDSCDSQKVRDFFFRKSFQKTIDKTNTLPKYCTRKISANFGFQYSIFLNVGDLNHVKITTSKVILPPNTTAGTVPISFAVTPLSNCPSSLLELTNIEFTLITRPRI